MNHRSTSSLDLLPNLAYIVMVLAGLVVGLAAVGTFDAERLKSLLVVGVGASLLATGIGGFLTQWIIAPHAARKLEDNLREVVGHPARLLPERKLLNNQYLALIDHGREIDIISLSLAAFFDNYPLQRLVEWILDKRKSFRILVLAPQSPSVALRGKQERIDLPQKIMTSMGQFEVLCDRLHREIESGKVCNGSLEVRTYEGIPHFAYFRGDDTAILGLYYSHLPGAQSEALLMRKEDGPIFEKLEDNFEFLWGEKSSGKENPVGERRACFIFGKETYINMQTLRSSHNRAPSADG